jgi:hypothetical protein
VRRGGGRGGRGCVGGGGTHALLSWPLESTVDLPVTSAGRRLKGETRPGSRWREDGGNVPKRSCIFSWSPMGRELLNTETIRSALRLAANCGLAGQGRAEMLSLLVKHKRCTQTHTRTYKKRSVLMLWSSWFGGSSGWGQLQSVARFRKVRNVRRARMRCPPMPCNARQCLQCPSTRLHPH